MTVFGVDSDEEVGQAKLDVHAYCLVASVSLGSVRERQPSANGIEVSEHLKQRLTGVFVFAFLKRGILAFRLGAFEITDALSERISAELGQVL